MSDTKNPGHDQQQNTRIAVGSALLIPAFDCWSANGFIAIRKARGLGWAAPQDTLN